MFSDKTHIQQLVRLMHEHGISDVVLCPGSRNAPICHTLAQSELFQCHTLTDERSAAFFALGIALATGQTVAVCVTSGSALLNTHPAVAEAYYQRVPLAIISADRPAAWIGQMDGQTLPQSHALDGVVKMSVSLPEVHTSEEEWYCNRLLNEALLECTHRTLGPIHINVPISEPLYTFNTDILPQQRVIHRIEGLYPAQMRQISELLGKSQRRMIILGQKPVDRQVQPAYRGELHRAFVSLCEHLANAGEGSIAISLTDELLDAMRPEDIEAYRPDLVITLCGHIVSKKLKQFLRANPPAQHWHVSPDGSVADLFGCLTTVIEAKPYLFLEALALITIPLEEDNPYPALWRQLKAQRVLQEDSAEQACVGRLLSMLPSNAVLHLANSSTVRYAQHYALPPQVAVCCNRGVNGIEGSLSTAIGYATATPHQPHFIITGDLSFFYDQNAFWNTALPPNLHILLLNNGGGKIFDTLPVPSDPLSRQAICGKHTTSAAAIAGQYGFRYLTNESQLSDFVASTDNVILELNFYNEKEENRK